MVAANIFKIGYYFQASHCPLRRTRWTGASKQQTESRSTGSHRKSSWKFATRYTISSHSLDTRCQLFDICGYTSKIGSEYQLNPIFLALCYYDLHAMNKRMISSWVIDNTFCTNFIMKGHIVILGILVLLGWFAWQYYSLYTICPEFSILDASYIMLTVIHLLSSDSSVKNI